MLRRKLLIRIGLLVACFVMGAAVAVSLLQQAIPDIDRINRDAVVLIDGVHTADDCVAEIENARDGLPPSGPVNAQAPDERLRVAMSAIGAHDAIKIAGSPQARSYAKLVELLPEFMEPASSDAASQREHRTHVHQAMRELARSVRGFVAGEQASFGRYFRGLVLGLTLAALVMVNVAVFVLLRTAMVVLKPVGQLVEGSRELAAERFDHRVNVEQGDEFGELATAYNRLAEQLQANEERKAETLRQLAVTLNHDLNNAMATIEMQLSLVGRQSGGNSNLERYCREIQTTLSRMSKTVASLKHIRRVVLTDYLDGQKMVDLERSVDAGEVRASHSPADVHTTGMN
ncbi:MAG: HAMP domain-containing protein [Phycisphaerales bacterium]|nr:HAMP domain-containing protein [Phycisphaerales bacterium]